MLTYGVPKAVEESAKGFVKKQIEIEVRDTYQASRASSLEDKAWVIANKLGYEEQELRRDLENQLPEKIAEIIAAMCGYDCERKRSIARSMTSGYVERIADISIAQHNLGDMVKGKYVEIVSALKADLRIFLGVNSIMFLLLLLVSLLKPRAIEHLFLPGMLLLLSTVAASAIYLFGQDWFYTILYNDYLGYGYLAYLAVIFAFLLDVVFNSARITTDIINAILEAVGSALSVAPC